MELIAKNIFGELTEEQIESATQYFQMDSTLVECDLAREIMMYLPEGDYIIDTRVHMLKPGWYPCIPGWHFDEFCRDEQGKLDFVNARTDMEHYLFIYDIGTDSLTEFTPMLFTRDMLLEEGIKDYKTLNNLINERTNTWGRVESNNLIKFGLFDAHRGMPASGSGWRYFFRASKNDGRKPINKIRKQTQVYIPAPDIEKGW